MHNEMSVLRAQDLGVSYRDGDRTVTPVKSVSLELHAGVVYCLGGRSGAGKTTLLHLLLGMELPAAQDRRGTVWFDERRIDTVGESAHLRRDRVVYVAQAAELVQFLRVADNLRISEALGGEKITLEACEAALHRLGVDDLANRFPSEISGGERQRCAVARCLVRTVPLLVIDEPTSSLDNESADLVVSAIRTVRDSGTTVLVASHDKRLDALADVSWVLEGGTLRCF